MIRSLRIQHFRSHRHVNLENLGRINLLTGMNNTGKTVALEALFLLAIPGYPQLALNQLNRLRGYTSTSDLTEAWDSLFYNWDRAKEIVLEVEEDNSISSLGRSHRNSQKRSLHIRPSFVGETDEFIEENWSGQGRLFDDTTGVIDSAELVGRTRGLMIRSISSDGQSIVHRITGSSPEALMRSQRVASELEEEASVAFIPARGTTSFSQEAQRYSRLQIERRETEVLEILQIIDPRLRGLVIGATRRGSAIYGDLGTNHLVPLSVMGDGMARTLSIALSMANSQDGVVLIDEVENGLHYSVLVSLWDLIARTARLLNVQVFAATHSDECIRAVNEAMQNLNQTQDLRLYRFDLSKDGTRVTDYNARELAAAIETEQEVR